MCKKSYEASLTKYKHFKELGLDYNAESKKWSGYLFTHSNNPVGLGEENTIEDILIKAEARLK